MVIRIKLKGKKIIINDSLEISLEDKSDTEIYDFMIFLVNHFMAV